MAITTIDLASRLTVQQMRIFCTVFEQKGYVGAAKILDLSGPTMWEQIQSLEKLYRTKLFERRGRNIEPTANGRSLHRLLLSILAQIESTIEVIGQDSNAAPEEVSLAVGTRMILEELGRPLKQFQQSFPSTRLRLTTGDSDHLQQLVADSQSDIALMIEPPQDLIREGLTYTRLYPIEYLAVFPARHRLTRKKSIALADLVDEPLILGHRGTIGRRMIESAWVRSGFAQPLCCAVETDNSAVSLACVRAGLGIAIIADNSQHLLTRSLHTRSLRNDIGQVFVVAAYRRGRILTAALMTLIELLQSVAPKQDSRLQRH